ncbi:probable hydrolase PNKD [Tachyglossus aculeatus]|uniref:probable hydrolase PNKD n=1 Tax=Tachyglossus aculeatus TaxID=9261 RepID=UPI0018F590A5|nr:probable hydrolase PNKD [Tachyglossus aculeatus]XP_038606708.1 probable hydrolase PNKD [Tachyglossus aculeatus]XP_038607206.1 probable hydrolase PNKD [Tachyglossus aculeatus]
MRLMMRTMMMLMSVGLLSGVAARRTPWLGLRPVHGRAGAPRGQAEPGQVPPGVEYIPQKTAKNPMRPVGLAWAIGFPCGILLFIFTKRQVDRNRAKQLRARRNMRAANAGAYERQRYLDHASGPAPGP